MDLTSHLISSAALLPDYFGVATFRSSTSTNLVRINRAEMVYSPIMLRCSFTSLKQRVYFFPK